MTVSVEILQVNTFSTRVNTFQKMSLYTGHVNVSCAYSIFSIHCGPCRNTFIGRFIIPMLYAAAFMQFSAWQCKC